MAKELSEGVKTYTQDYFTFLEHHIFQSGYPSLKHLSEFTILVLEPKYVKVHPKRKKKEIVRIAKNILQSCYIFDLALS
jgi:hypothetical protein